MSQNYPKSCWEALKRVCFPDIHGEIERKLMGAFFQGMSVSHKLTMDAVMDLKMDDTVQFFRDFQAQLKAALAEVKMVPGTVKLSQMPKVVASINEETIS